VQDRARGREPGGEIGCEGSLRHLLHCLPVSGRTAWTERRVGWWLEINDDEEEDPSLEAQSIISSEGDNVTSMEMKTRNKHYIVAANGEKTGRIEEQEV